MAITINHQTNDISVTSGSMTIDGSELPAEAFGPYGLPYSNSGSSTSFAKNYGLGPYTDNRVYYSKGVYSTDGGNNDIYVKTASGTSSKIRLKIPFKSIDYENTNLGTTAVLVKNDFGSGSGEGWLYLGAGASIYTEPSQSRRIMWPDWFEMRNVSDAFFDKGFS